MPIRPATWSPKNTKPTTPMMMTAVTISMTPPAPALRLRLSRRLPPLRRRGLPWRMASSSWQKGHFFIGVGIFLTAFGTADGAHGRLLLGQIISIYIISVFLPTVNRNFTGIDGFSENLFPALLFPAADSIMDLTNGVRPRDKKEDRTMTDTIFIGIAGGTGSGKTTLTEHIKSDLGTRSASSTTTTTTGTRRGCPLRSAAARTTTTPTL